MKTLKGLSQKYQHHKKQEQALQKEIKDSMNTKRRTERQKQIQNYIADESAESTIESASALAKKLTEEGRQLWLSNDITDAQKDSLKQMAKAQLNELLARTFGEITGGLATIEGIQQRYRVIVTGKQIGRAHV